jgi:hypothetical protein
MSSCNVPFPVTVIIRDKMGGVTALASFIQQRLNELDINYETVAARTKSWDRGLRGKGTGLDSDTVRRIARGERRTIQERTLHLLALALSVSPADLRAVAEDRSRDSVLEYVPPSEAHGPLVTPRLQNSWTEGIRAIAEALEAARQTGWDAGYAQALRDQAGADPVAVAEAMGASDPDSLPWAEHQRAATR